MPRYARRTREVDEAILGTYLSGANSRRICKALKPLLGEEHLSKSAVSRVVSRLKERFEEWQNRALSEEVYAIVYLDGFHMKVRMASQPRSQEPDRPKPEPVTADAPRPRRPAQAAP